jgi:hypothetical protein
VEESDLIIRQHGEKLQDHDERILTLESSSILESKRIDNLCQQLSEFSHDIKEMLKIHDDRIIDHELDSVKKEKDILSLSNSLQGVLAIIKWTASSVFLLLAGFFIWYIQSAL